MEAKSLFQSPIFADSFYFPFNPDPLAPGNNYDTYDEMRLDDQIKAAINIKKDMVINTGWSIECEDEKVKEFLDKALREMGEDEGESSSLEDTLRDILSAYEYGFSLTEPVYIQKDGLYTYKELKTRPPHTFRFNIAPSGKVKTITQSQSSGDVDMPPTLFIHHVYQQAYGNPYGHSDLASAHTAWKMKKFVLRFYAMYLERWASPTVVGKYDRSLSVTEASRLHEMLKTVQQKTAFAFPNDMAVELLYPQRDGGDAYQKAVDLCNMMMARSILVPDLLGIGGSETKGGSLALGKEHFKIFLNTIMKDRQSLERKLTVRLIRPLVKVNFGDIDASFKFNAYTEDDVSAYLDLWVKAVSGKIFKPNEDEVNYFRQKVGFPEGPVELPSAPIQLDPEGNPIPPKEGMPGEKPVEEGKKEEKGEGKEEAKPAAREKKEEKEFALKPFREYTSYEKKVDFSAIKKAMDDNEASLSKSLTSAAKDVYKDYVKQIKDKGIIRRFKPEALNDIIPKFRRDMHQVLKTGYRELFREAVANAKKEILPKGVGHSSFVAKFAEALLPDEYERVFESESFKSVKDYSDMVMKKGGNIVTNGIKAGKGEGEIVFLLIEELEGETDKWISTVTRTKTTELYNTARRSYWENDDIAKQIVVAYQFSAVMDSRTSDVCASLDEKIFEIGDDVARVTPPIHWNCRSLLVPITKFEQYESVKVPTLKAVNEKGGNLKDF